MTERKAFDAQRILGALTGFQRNTVEHIIDRFYGPSPSDRFMVADETGLGKTIVARGVIARTIEELQHNDKVERIDIVYICSNLDLAQQNLSKLNVTSDTHHGIASRLTLLAKHVSTFTPPGADGLIKPVNLVSFTPGTSFTKGWASGTAPERAMIYLLLEDELGLSNRRRARAAREVLQGALRSPDGLAWHVDRLREELPEGVDPTIRKAFLEAVVTGEPSLRDEFDYLIEHINGIKDSWGLTNSLTGRLRAVLARESVRLLTPDLVILDEFQRFRDLLNETTEAGELAHHLFNYREAQSEHTAKVLLLSATPFKPFTYAEEAHLGEDHYRDFMEVIRFLANGDEVGVTRRVSEALKEYRNAVVTGNAEDHLTRDVRTALLAVMTRAERPRTLAVQMSQEEVTELEPPPEEDLLGFVALRRLAKEISAPLSIEYWKSAPFFVNFMDGYKIRDKVRSALLDPQSEPAVRSLLHQTQQIDFAAVNRLAAIGMGNSRMRALAARTVDAGLWKLLWMPPSLPYLQPGGPFAEDFARSATKSLVFSSWAATPTAVATLLSYEAERLGSAALRDTSIEDRARERKNRRNRLAFRLDREGDRDRPSAMSTMAVFWPMPGLAALADPRSAELHRQSPDGLDAAQFQAYVVDLLRRDHVAEPDADPSGPSASHWYEALRRLDSRPDQLTEAQAQEALSGSAEVPDGRPDDESDPESSTAGNLLGRHIQLAFKIRGAAQDRRVTDQTVATIADVAAHSPGNIAYRALRRLVAEQPEVTEVGLWRAAARISAALRTLFSRPETVLLLDELIPDELPYWHKVLRYCSWGNLQAVMDEYVHHLEVGQGMPAIEDVALMDLAVMVATALELRSTSYEVFDPANPDTSQKFWPRFALRFGGRRDNQESSRQPLVRQAFNSPFWPFVLATTSVGQEGVDFHWWSHAVVHWNTPANPIDFEQREGRVDRYDGHAVRRNIAARHRQAILTSDAANPWKAAYQLAQDRVADLGEFAPHWVYPGEAHIERHVSPYPLSIDTQRLEEIKRDVALYRLTFGQPRQEDMLELLRLHFSDATPEQLDALRLDLSAPRFTPTITRGGA